MRRLEAMFRDTRNSVRSNNKVGNTESSTARRICTAERKTIMEAAIERANKKSSANAGNGISITKITLIAPRGSRYSRRRSSKDTGANDVGVKAAVLIVRLRILVDRG